ncbi:MAG: SRPBCC family protein [Pseudomonadota bacterium]
MDRATEVRLIREILGLHDAKSAFLDDDISHSPVQHYLDSERFSAEQDRILRRQPQAVVHSSELPEAGSYLRRDFAGLPVLFTRDSTGQVHAFLNVCRHRGGRLVRSHAGCKQRFSCPYHAWTYDNRGQLVGVPHEQQGFPGLDRDKLGLKRLGCVEKYGWIWAWGRDDGLPDIGATLSGLAEDLEWLQGTDLHILHAEEQVRSVNWKILVEGGIEAYHFRVAHRNTIAPYFLDNVSTYVSFGAHVRSILAKRSITDLRNQPEESWRIRDHAQVLYSIFPTSQFLVQSDHIAWIQSTPVDVETTKLRLSTLVPKNRMEAEGDLAHWAKNHAITVQTLNEDFDIGEEIQAGLKSGANEYLTFGRFEGALDRFNRVVNERLLSSSV